jgi:hypothetical protein
MKRPETRPPEIVLVIDEIEALQAADTPTGLRAHLVQVLAEGRPADATCPAPAWLAAGELAALTSALVAAEVGRAASPT